MLSAQAAAEQSLNWRSLELRRHITFCAAYFHVRAEWMVKFEMNSSALMREFTASDDLQRIYSENVTALGWRPSRSPDEKRPPMLHGPLTRQPANLGSDVYWARLKLVQMFTDSGAMNHRPPVCLEDETCGSCWDLLRQLQAQDD
jgi:hypothetical protein